LEPVFAALFATMLGGERLSVPELLGCGLILAGMLATQLER
jgi:drug/metabolite transporter (DMT)-like permease